MSKKNLVLGSVLIVLIVLAYLYQGPLKDWRINKGKEKNFLAQVNPKSLDKIEVDAAGIITTLEKTGDRWKVDGSKDFYVNSDIAGDLISSLEEAIKSDLELVSGSKDKKAEFKTDDSGVKVKLYQGNDVKADFIVGKIGNDYKSTYISKADLDKTFSVSANLFSSFNQPDWRDQIIFSSDKLKISKIRFQLGKTGYSAEKSGDDWKAAKPYYYKLSKEKIEKILEIMANLSAVKIPEQSFSGTGLEKNNIIIQATGDGVDNTLMIGDADKDGNYYAKRGNSDNIYLISKSQKDELNKKIQELK